MNDFLSFLINGGILRSLIMNIPLQICSLLFIHAMLGKGRKVWMYLTFIIIKSQLLVWLSAQYFPANSSWPEIATIATTSLGAVFSCLLFLYTFRAEPVKGFLCIAVVEILCMISSIPAYLIVNKLEGNSNLLLIYAPLQPFDALFVILIPVFSILVYFVLKNALVLYQKFEIKHRHLGIAVCILYFALTQLSSIDIPSKNFAAFLWVDVLFLFFPFFIYRNYRQETALESASVNTQLNLIQSQYRSVREQVSYMNSCKKLIEEQMQELSRIENSEQSNVSPKTAGYIQKLRSMYKHVNAGVYCSNWAIDSVLYTQIDLAQQRGFSVSCEVNAVLTEQEDAELLSRVLLSLFDFLFRSFSAQAKRKKTETSSVEKVSVKICQVHSEYILLFTCPYYKPDYYMKKSLKSLVGKDRGTVQYQKQGDDLEVAVMWEV